MVAKKKAAQKKAPQFEGTVETVNIKGAESEASHQCLFGMQSLDGQKTEAIRLNPFQPAAKYRALLRLLVDACLNHGVTTVDLQPAKGGTPFGVRIVTAQDGATQRGQAKRRASRAGDVWSFIGQVVHLQAGTETQQSRFTLCAGKKTAVFTLDSIANPKRAAAMLQVVAAAFGAGATLRVNGTGARRRQLAIEIEMGPFGPA